MAAAINLACCCAAGRLHDSTAMRLSFVYPMYNEIGNIEKMTRSTREIAARTLSEFEIIVVDDCSTDGSGELVESLKSTIPELRVIRHSRNRKLGGALKTGFAAAKMDYILYMDSDIPVAFDDVEEFLRGAPSELDMVIGYRIGGAENKFRDAQSLCYNLLLRAVFGLRVRDANFAFKLFKRELVETPLQSEGSFIDAEMILEARRRGYRIREAGFVYQLRQAGVSTIGGPRVIPKLLAELIRYRRASRAKEKQVRREVIFNADDFGLCASINRGVMASHQDGLVRAASLICTGDAFEEAAEYARNNPSLDLGLHFSLVDGTPVSDASQVPTLTGPDGRLHASYGMFLRRYVTGRIAVAEIEAEFRAQLSKVREAGLRITHIDSHQHLHVLPAILEIVTRLAKEHGIPAVRLPDERGAFLSLFRGPMRRWLPRAALSLVCRLSKSRLAHDHMLWSDNFLGMADAGTWNTASMAARIKALPEGLTEICCHPREEPAVEKAYDWGYKHRDEMDALTSTELSALLASRGVHVTNFSDYFHFPVPRIRASTR